MLSYLLALCLVAVVLLCIALRKAYHYLPIKELKRQAEADDPVARTLWRAVAFGGSVDVLLWLVLGFASATAVVLLANVAPPLLAFVAVVLLLWLAFAWLPSARLTGWEVRLAEWLTPVVVWGVSTLEPVLHVLQRYVGPRPAAHLHTGVYIREDLLDLIEKQKSQEGNRLSIEELDLASAALQFGQKKVRDIMTTRKTVHVVAADDDVSPVFLDELHQTMHSSFPVYEGDKNNFVGILHLRSLTDISKGKGAKGRVASHMDKGVVYVHESDSLADALHAFYFSKKPLFIVINSFEEYVGIITIEDILRALLGASEEYGFDQFESRTAVAGRHTKKPKHIDEHIDETVPAGAEKPDDMALAADSVEEVIE